MTTEQHTEVTADNLTDEQIRDFMVGLAVKIVGTMSSYAADVKINALRRDARVALKQQRARPHDSRDHARQRIVAAINARAKADGYKVSSEHEANERALEAMRLTKADAR